jgi:hypothetical protein
MLLLALVAALPEVGQGEQALMVIVAEADALSLPLADSHAGYLGGTFRLPPTRATSLRLASTELGQRVVYDGLLVLRGEDIVTFAIGPGPRAFRVAAAPSAATPLVDDPELRARARVGLAGLSLALLLFFRR